MTLPKANERYSYKADTTRAAHPALAGLDASTEVTVKSADKNQVKIGWTDSSGSPREAAVPASTFGDSFTKKA